jgi:hypothetical protein
MAIKLFELGFILKAIDGGLVGGLSKVSKTDRGAQRCGQTNRSAARGAGANLAFMDAGIAAAGAAIALPLKSAVEAAASVDQAM